jgi:hypothetical protein
MQVNEDSKRKKFCCGCGTVLCSCDVVVKPYAGFFLCVPWGQFVSVQLAAQLSCDINRYQRYLTLFSASAALFVGITSSVDAVRACFTNCVTGTVDVHGFIELQSKQVVRKARRWALQGWLWRYEALRVYMP